MSSGRGTPAISRTPADLRFGSLKATLGLLPGNFARLIGSDEWRAFLKDKKLVEVTLDHGKRGQKPKAYQLAT